MLYYAIETSGKTGRKLYASRKYAKAVMREAAEAAARSATETADGNRRALAHVFPDLKKAAYSVVKAEGGLDVILEGSSHVCRSYRIVEFDIEDREEGDGDGNGDASSFALSDGSDNAAPHRVLIVWGEDLDGTPDTLANVLELMRDNLDADGQTNHHIERFGTAAEKQAFLKGLRYDSVSYDNYLVLTDEGDIEAVIAKYEDESTRKSAD